MYWVFQSTRTLSANPSALAVSHAAVPVLGALVLLRAIAEQLARPAGLGCDLALGELVAQLARVVLELADATIKPSLLLTDGRGPSQGPFDAVGLGVERCELLIGRSQRGGQARTLGGVRVAGAPERRT